MIRLPALACAALAAPAAWAQHPAPDTPLPTVIAHGAGLCAGTARSIPAPGEGAFHGLAVLGNALWLGRGGKLYELEVATGAVRRVHDAPAETRDLAADGRFLYAVDGSWHAGAPILVLDPLAGRVVREIASPTDRGTDRAPAIGLASHREMLYVLDRNLAIHEVDPHSGAVERSWRPTSRTGRPLIRPGAVALTSDGEKLVAASRSFLSSIDLDDAARVGLTQVHLPPGGLAFAEDAYYLVGQDEAGGAIHEFRLERTDIVLTVGVTCVKPGEWIPDPDVPDELRFAGREILFEIGPRRVSLESLTVELERVARDPELRRADPVGSDELGGVLVLPRPNTVLADVQVAVDALRAAGFRDIRVAGVLPRQR